MNKQYLKIAMISMMLASCSTTLIASPVPFPTLDDVQFTLKQFPANTILHLSGLPSTYNLPRVTVNSDGTGSFNAEFEVNVQGKGAATLYLSSKHISIGCPISFEDDGNEVFYEYTPYCQHLNISAIKPDPVYGIPQVTVTYTN